MKLATRLMLIPLAAAAAGLLASPGVSAQGHENSARTRAEVRAEAIAAQRAGLIPNGEAAWMPDSRNFVSTRTRAEVRAEAIQALRAGQIVSGESYQAPDYGNFVSTKTRAQVVAELREAQRLGLVHSRGEAGPVIPTAEQLRLIAEAGERAVAEGRVASR